MATEAAVPVHVEEFEGRVEGGFRGTTPGGKEGTVADRVRDTVSPESEMPVENISSTDLEVCAEGAASDWH